ncbi:MAG: prepilin-type N-terminal cleavage/methylation domain-containing protein [Candidatus Roizmanbacteria bacterium]|nr:prepilin-type N-terminal cleavage/methylation domain-containing protein [Candidatus Roizmanbacteria bacterium]
MKKGFTLVEILVVVTIISLLASIAAVSYSRFVKQSRDARRKTDIEQIRASIELYRNFKGTYPAPPMNFGTGALQDGTTVYMSKIPSDPMSSSPTSNTYFYTSSGTFQDYTLCAYIEGGDTSVSLNSCGSGIICNYCMGPYGQK